MKYQFTQNKHLHTIIIIDAYLIEGSCHTTFYNSRLSLGPCLRVYKYESKRVS